MSMTAKTEQELIATDIEAYLARNQKKDLMRFLTCGSVDDGKSTLIGRLLYDSKTVYEDQMAALKAASERKSSAGVGELDLAQLTDGLQAEVEQGITIDVAYRYFSTPRRKFIIADTPGHEQYTRNMATGASTANLAIILIDARNGVLPQTRRHSFIASLLGIKHIVVAINKMDLVGFSEERFEQIKEEYTNFVARLDLGDIKFIPMSALKGDNVVQSSASMPWYQGGPLLDYLETVHIASDRNLIDLRFPVQYVLRPDLNFRGFAGTVGSGVIRKGDNVLALPSGRQAVVKSLVTYEGEQAEAFAPQATVVTLDREIDLGRGDMLVHTRNVPHRDRRFEAMVVWMNAEPLKEHKNYQIKHTTNLVNGQATQILYKMDVNTVHRQKAAGTLEMNEIGRVVIELNRAVFFDAYKNNRSTGAIIFVDPVTNVTVGAGMILDRDPNELVVGQQAAEVRHGVELKIKKQLVSTEERAEKLGQKAVTVWFTGLPKAGKSTLAYAVEKKLFELGKTTFVFDGVTMRLGLSKDLGFTADDRSENSRRAAEVAKLFTNSGLITLGAFVSPYATDREIARTVVGKDRFIEIYLNTPVEACEQRDPKLYGDARSGKLKNFTGISAPYEAPTAPDLVLPTHELDLNTCVERVIELLKKRGVIS